MSWRRSPPADWRNQGSGVGEQGGNLLLQTRFEFDLKKEGHPPRKLSARCETQESNPQTAPATRLIVSTRIRRQTQPISAPKNKLLRSPAAISDEFRPRGGNLCPLTPPCHSQAIPGTPVCLRTRRLCNALMSYNHQRLSHTSALAV